MTTPAPTGTDDRIACWVCVDCYFAHHYGYTEVDREPTDDELHAWHGGYLRGHDLPNMVASEHAENDDGLMVREWFAGDSDTPADCQPLCRLEGLELSDWTYDDSDPENTEQIERYGDGHTDFTWSSCGGCGSTLGGGRERLAIWPAKETT